MPYEFITVERQDAVAILTFNRPKVLNAFHNPLMAETTAVMAELDADAAIRAIVVRGAGRAFSAGFDLQGAAGHELETVQDWEDQMRFQFDFIMQFWHAATPTLAAVHGYCLAGAFELALACDLTLAADDAVFGEPEVRFGTGIVAMLLPWATGPKHAKEILLTGEDRLSAEDAFRMGIVNRLYPADEVFDATLAKARAVATAAERAVTLTKRAINESYERMGFSGALGAALDIDVLLNAGSSPEKAEFARIRREKGVKAAIAWRDARFRDD